MSGGWTKVGVDVLVSPTATTTFVTAMGLVCARLLAWWLLVVAEVDGLRGEGEVEVEMEVEVDDTVPVPVRKGWRSLRCCRDMEI